MDQDHRTPVVARSRQPLFAVLASTARRRAGVDVVDLAETVGVSPSVVECWEAGEVIPTPGVLVAVCEALDVDLDHAVEALFAG